MRATRPVPQPNPSKTRDPRKPLRGVRGVEPEDTDSIARIWRTAGRVSIKFDDRPPFN